MQQATATGMATATKPPFPDRAVSTTFWMSLALGLLGLDHFFLRSPQTGIWKALTLGGFGLWWLWDVLQLWFEPERSAIHGLTAPFNLAAGIGKGQLTTSAVHIHQRTDYFNWFLSALLDVVGLNALVEGRPAAFLRRLIDGVLLLFFVSTGTLFGYLMAAIFAFFTVVPSVYTLAAIWNPARLAEKGVHIPPNLVKLLNFFESWTDIIGPNATAVVRKDFGLTAVDAVSAPNAFGYADDEVLAQEAEAAQATATGGSTSGGATKKELTSWPISLLLGNVFGGAVLGVVNLFSWVPTVKMGLFAADSYFAAVRASRGETPDAPGNLLGSLPLSFAGGLTGGLTKSLEGAAGGLTGGLTKSLEGAAGGLTGGLTKSLEGAAGGLTSSLEGAAGDLTKKLDQVRDVTRAVRTLQHGGGGQNQPALSSDAVVIGGVVGALILGGAIKGTVDFLSS